MADGRRSSASGNGLRKGLYRHGSNVSQTSFLDEVDMAQDDIFSGPVSESVPTSTTGFLHRRERAGSTTSFQYYDEDEEMDDDSWMEEEAILDDEENALDHGEVEGQYEERFEDQNGYHEEETNGEGRRSRRPSSKKRRKSSQLSRGSSRPSMQSPRAPLLRNSSTGSRGSNASGDGSSDRKTQKLYIQSEDLTIVIAGFDTSVFGFAVYITICILTFGLAYLLFRWLPSWRVRLIGRAAPLGRCGWVVIEVSTVLSIAWLRGIDWL